MLVHTISALARAFALTAIVALAAHSSVHAQPQGEGRRVALLIGNGDYRYVGRLDNPLNDVTAMGARLEAFGFDVMIVENADEREMARALRAFADEADGADTALFFYAGHGMEIAGRNYLIPVDAELEREEDALVEAIELERVTAAASGAVRLSVVIIDACRDSRFPASSRSGVRGFMPAQARRRQVVAFSTAPGDVAQDGEGDLSPYTQALLETLDSTAESIDVRVLFESFGDRVAELAGAPQRPRAWSEGFGVETVTLLPIGAADDGGGDGGAAPGLAVLLFDQAVAQESASLMQAFLDAFPDDPRRPEAESLMSVWAERAASESDRQSPDVLIIDEAAIGGDDEPSGGPYVFRDCPECPEMAALPGGAVVLGSPPDEPGRGAEEGPEVEVVVQPFALGVAEVTVAEFAAFVDATGHRAGSCFVGRGPTALGRRDQASWRDPLFPQGPDHPAVCISFRDALAYVAWLNEIAPEPVYRLPSEAEFAFAVRADSLGRWTWGDDPNAGCAFVNGYDAFAADEIVYDWPYATCSDGWTFTAPVATRAPNAFGLHDLIGNAWEWTSDCWNGSHGGADGGPRLDGDCARRVVRGGSWDDRPDFLRIAHRVPVAENVRTYVVGFRIARDLP